MNKKIIFLAFTLIIATLTNAQSQKYTVVDEVVKKLGPLPELNVATITDTITRNLANKEMKARAIFYWVTNHIAIDAKATKLNDQKNKDPENVIKLRRATAQGFSLLIQEMCSLVNIRCLSIDGYLKSFPEEINEKVDETNHSWNVIQLGESPEQWFYVDASRASGYLDKKMAVFTRQYTPQYFFADKLLFNLDHYADNAAWQLGPGPKNRKDFYALPVISSAAYQYGLKKPAPITGTIKTKINSPVNFSFPYNGAKLVSVDLLIGDNRKLKKPEHMNFSTNNNTLSFSYAFKEEDEFPIRIIVDGKELMAYQVMVKAK